MTEETTGPKNLFAYDVELASVIARTMISILETGTVWEEHRDAVVDVAGDRGGISYGPFQATETSGSLYAVVKAFVDAPPEEEEEIVGELATYLRSLERGAVPRADRRQLMDALQWAARFPEMARAQDAVFDRLYLQPAALAAIKLGLTGYPLSLAAVLDGFVHGSFWKIANRERSREERWIEEYLMERRRWLAARGGLLARTVYRMDEFLELIADRGADAWALDLPLRFRGVRIDMGTITGRIQDPLPRPARPVIRLGSQGWSVMDLQGMLESLGYDVNTDGVFGRSEQVAVRSIQHIWGLTVDGIVGPQTWGKLDELMAMLGEQAVDDPSPTGDC